MGSGPFSDMAVNETNRKAFIHSSVKFLRKWKFDGLDLDWEFPVCHFLLNYAENAFINCM